MKPHTFLFTFQVLFEGEYAACVKHFKYITHVAKPSTTRNCLRGAQEERDKKASLNPFATSSTPLVTIVLPPCRKAESREVREVTLLPFSDRHVLLNWNPRSEFLKIVSQGMSICRRTHKGTLVFDPLNRRMPKGYVHAQGSKRRTVLLHRCRQGHLEVPSRCESVKTLSEEYLGIILLQSAISSAIY